MSDKEEAANLMMLIMRALQEFSKTGVAQVLCFGDGKITIEKYSPEGETD